MMMMMAWQGRLVKGVGEIQLKPSFLFSTSKQEMSFYSLGPCMLVGGSRWKCHFIDGSDYQNILTLNLTSLNFNYFLIVNFFRYFLSFLFFVCTFNTRVNDNLMSVTLGLMLDHGITRVGEPNWASESWTASEVCSWANIIHIITKDKFQKWIKVFMWFNMEAF